MFPSSKKLKKEKKEYNQRCVTQLWKQLYNHIGTHKIIPKQLLRGTVFCERKTQ